MLDVRVGQMPSVTGRLKYTELVRVARCLEKSGNSCNSNVWITEVGAPTRRDQTK